MNKFLKQIKFKLVFWNFGCLFCVEWFYGRGLWDFETLWNGL